MDGKMILHLFAKDTSGKVIVWGGYDTYFKKSIPTITNVNFNGYQEGKETKNDIKVNVTADSYYGIAKYQISYDSGLNWHDSLDNEFMLIDNTIKTVRFRVIDTKNTISEATRDYSININKKDTDKPVVTKIEYEIEYRGNTGNNKDLLIVTLYVNEALKEENGLKKISETDNIYQKTYEIPPGKQGKNHNFGNLEIKDLAGNKTTIEIKYDLPARPEV